MTATTDTPNMAAIRRVLDNKGLALGERPAGTLRAVPDWVLFRPVITRKQLAYYLDDIVESEWENWILDCFKGEHGKYHLLPELRAYRGYIYGK